MGIAKKDLGDILLSKGKISQQQLAEAKSAQKAAPGDLGRIIVDLGHADDRTVAEARAEVMNMAFVDLSTYKIDPSVTGLVSETLAKKYKLIPLGKNGPNLMVAMADPNNIVALQDIRIASGASKVVAALATEDDVMAAIDRTYKVSDGGESTEGSTAASALASGMGGLSADIRQGLASYGAREEATDDDNEALKISEEAPIVRLAYSIIQLAINDGASDIHVEPGKRGVRVRYRVDGVLHEVMPLPKYIDKPLTSRFKIMSDMNIAERRIPQDGRIGIVLNKKDFDLRVSCLPTVNGEKMVMRILDKTSVLLGLNKLGFTEKNQSELEELTIQPNGLFLSTGPTGSGKTTTQYSVLHKLNTVEKNILTIEDPVEYQLTGVAQVQVNKKAGLTFASALRSFLRQDPDIIMVGEMRDLETADIAIESSLTGHLVLSTLHTNDAPSAVIRMIDMGVEPYLISATLIGVLAQRLARKICPKCKTAYEVPGSDLHRFGFRPKDPSAMIELFRGAGCDNCRNTGYRGRIGIYELMRINDEIRELVTRRAPLADVREAAKANGMSELKEDGLQKVLQGVTTPDEVMRVVFTAGG